MHPTVATIGQRYPSGFLIPEEAAAELRLHYQTVLSHIKAGRLIAGNYGMGRRRQYRITLHALSDFVKRCEAGSLEGEQRSQPEPASTDAVSRRTQRGKRHRVALVAA